MRIVKYKRHWSFLGPGVKTEEPLTTFLFDIPYFCMISCGIIPPFHILREYLRSGGDNGGMGPGTSWRPFVLKEAEYEAAVAQLLQTDAAPLCARHPYLSATRFFLDLELDSCSTYLEWSTEVYRKYPLRAFTPNDAGSPEETA
ncbi:MAG: hypothetical protein MUD01_08765 [Chloroflexaceae bacterium]|jgi:hypothetical protein|nr:hypothetical protein [Chloroflexaceae bacterium]